MLLNSRKSGVLDSRFSAKRGICDYYLAGQPMHWCTMTEWFSGKPISRLSDSIIESMRMMGEIQRIREELPCIDCGSCGAPNCRAFAEDVVKKEANIEDCLIRNHNFKKEGECNDGE